MELLNEETPAYKLQNQGTRYLNDCELLALLIGGSAKLAAEKARAICTTIGPLREIARWDVDTLAKAGLTHAEACRVVACFEIARRRALTPLTDRPKIASSRNAFDCIGELLADKLHEEFWVLILNKNNEVTDRIHHTTGGQSGTVCDLKMVFKEALMKNAAAIILVHNHPSGNLQPSQADMDLTKRAVAVGRAMDMPVLDHLIVSPRGYYSFADEGII